MLPKLLSVLSLLLCLNESINQSNAAVSFITRTIAAPWSKRWDSNMEYFNQPVNFVLQDGTTRTFQNALIIQGDGDDAGSKATNDIWASPDKGITWHLVAGMGSGGQAHAPYHMSSFSPVLTRPATGIDSKGGIYRIGGRRADGIRPQSSVWRSTDAGKSWKNMAAVNQSVIYRPARDRSNIIVDSSDHLYLVGGQARSEGDLMTNTVWKSADFGSHWEQLPPAPWRPRASGLMLNHFSKPLGKDVLTYLTGFDGRGGEQGLYNEIWISANHAETWKQVRTNWGNGLPPFKRRDAANGEITDLGILVLVGGQHVWPNGTLEALNDIWVSMDGGFQWGLCNEDAPFADRRDLLTAMDDQGYLFVAGGTDYATGAKFNDVWRSTISFNNPATVSAQCNLPMPACGPGIACLPGDPLTTFLSNGTVTCPRVRKCANQSEHYLDFPPATEKAPWSARWWLNAEYFGKTITYRNTTNQLRTVRNPLIVHGGDVSTNDVWASSDKGANWELIAGTGAYGTQATTSYSPAYPLANSIVNQKTNHIIRVGGYNGSNVVNDVWVTSDAVNWIKQPATDLPPRAQPHLLVDDNGKLFFSGGILSNGSVGKDLWSSVDNGATWTMITAELPWATSVGRAKGFLLGDRVPQLANKNVLYSGAGWDGSNFYNDIWASSNDGVSWGRITARAPFGARDAAAAEITTDGLIIISGGQTGGTQQNDAWVSADGGYTWGACSHEAFWSDRREPAGVIDGDGYFYIMGGRANADTDAEKFNDVYRSTLSLDNYNAVAEACNIKISPCGPGLICWPGAPGTVVTPTGVTCPAIEECLPPVPRPSSSSSSTGRRSSSSSSSKKPYNPCDDEPCDEYCDPDPYWNPECFSSSSSTGSGVTTGSGLSMGVIIAIIALLLAVVLGGGYWYYKRHNSNNAASIASMTEMGKASSHTNNAINQSLLSDDQPASTSNAPAAF